MNLGVLLLFCKEGRMTSFTREWAERAIQRVADYVLAQSGGRETISFKVYDWIKLPMTAAEWGALGFGAYSSVRPTVEQEVGESLDPYTHILIGIDVPQASGGATASYLTPSVTHLAAQNFSPSNVGHELGHRYGAGDAFGETADGPVVYQDSFCVMGGRGFPLSFFDEALADPNAPNLNRSGPGMCAPTLMATGWLKEGEHGVGLDLSHSNLSSGVGRIVELSALAGAPGPGWMPPPVVIRYQDLLVEYRVGVRDGWDRGLDPEGGAGGWVVAHRQDYFDRPPKRPSAVHIDSVQAKPGAMLFGEDGEDNPLDISNLGPLKISVLSFNAAARTVRLQFSRRAPGPAVGGTTHGGVDVGGGGWIWTPGRGFTPVPPHSPLVQVLAEVSRFQDLQEILAIASDDEVAGIFEEASRALRALQRSVAELRVEPSVSPLAHALEIISKLHGTSERLDSSTDDREMTQEFVEASRRQLAEVKRILANAVEEDR
jgi:hypothetical protein